MNRALAFALAACLAAGCSGPRPLRLGFKNTTEQAILAEVIAQHLEKALQREVLRLPPLGNTLQAHQALVSGEIDLYPEYAGAALAEILKEDAPPDSSVIWERVRGQYRERMQLEWLAPLGFKSGFALAVRNDDAGLRTVSNLAERRDGWRLGVTPEFDSRRDGMRRLMTAYEINVSAVPRMMAAAKLYEALEKKQVDIVAGLATDGSIDGVKVRALLDDRSAFVAADTGVVVRAVALAEIPGLRLAIEQLTGKITEKAMRTMNRKVETGGYPAAAARALLGN